MAERVRLSRSLKLDFAWLAAQLILLLAIVAMVTWQSAAAPGYKLFAAFVWGVASCAVLYRLFCFVLQGRDVWIDDDIVVKTLNGREERIAVKDIATIKVEIRRRRASRVEQAWVTLRNGNEFFFGLPARWPLENAHPNVELIMKAARPFGAELKSTVY